MLIRYFKVASDRPCGCVAAYSLEDAKRSAEIVFSPGFKYELEETLIERIPKSVGIIHCPLLSSADANKVFNLHSIGEYNYTHYKGGSTIYRE